MTELLNIFATKISEHGSEADADASVSDEEYKLEEDNEISNKTKDGEAEVLKEKDAITSDCDNILVLRKSVAVKAPRLVPTPCCRARKSAQWNGSGVGNTKIFPHLHHQPPPCHMTTWGSQESYVTSQLGFKKRNTSTQSPWISVRRTEI